MSDFEIDPKTKIGNIELQVGDLDRQANFYQDVLGFREVRGETNIVALSASGELPEQIILRELKGARPRSFSSPGLFHVAFLLPDRTELARILKRVADRHWRFQGFADHGVSEALYLSDPEGNGIELYRDRPMADWPRRGQTIEMFTKGLDVQDLLREVGDFEKDNGGIHPATTIGHVHLQVSNLQRAGRFYNEILGFTITQDSYLGALFVAADGYHHHIGLNTWNSEGAPSPLPDATGLLSFRITVSELENLDDIKRRLEGEKVGVDETDGKPSFQFSDPDGIRINLSVQGKVFSTG